MSDEPSVEEPLADEADLEEEGLEVDFDPDEEIEPDDSDDPGPGGNLGIEEGEDG